MKMIQVHVPERVWKFESSLRHHPLAWVAGSNNTVLLRTVSPITSSGIPYSIRTVWPGVLVGFRVSERWRSILSSKLTFICGSRPFILFTNHLI